MTLSLGNKNSAVFHGAASNATPIAITTVNADEIIVVICCAAQTSQPALHVASVSNPGTDPASLTWAKRSGGTALLNGGYTNCIEYWWAHAATPGTYNITVTFSASIDPAELAVCGVRGVPAGLLANPWSATAGITNSNSGGASVPPNGNYSPAELDVMPICVYTSNNNGSKGSYGAGYTGLEAITNSGGIAFGVLDSQFKIVSTGISGNQSFGSGEPGNQWLFSADALTSDTTPPPASKSNRSGFFFDWW